MPAALVVRGTRGVDRHDRLSATIRANGNRAAYNYARAVVKDAKARAPKRTGYMASQIKWRRISPGVFEIYVDGSVNAETGAFYAIYVEYGTRNMAAQPFFRPAIEAQRRQFKEDMRRLLR